MRAVRPVRFFAVGFFLVPLALQAQVFIPFSYWGCSNETSTFVDDNQSQFESGSATNISWDGSAMTLDAGQTSGTFIARPFEKSTRCVQPAPALSPMVGLAWVPNLPYGKELPATSESTISYTSLANSTLLNSIANIWHLNGTGSIVSGDNIPAQNGVAGTAVNANGTGLSYVTGGRLNSAISFDGTDHITVPYTQTSVSQYTISVWVRSNATGNRVFVENRGSGAGQSLTLSMGTNPGGCTATNGRVSFGVDSNGVYIGRCMSGGSINDNNWRHVVGVWSGTSGAAVAATQFTIYIDGAAVAMTSRTVGTAPTAPISGLGNMKIARHDPWSVNYSGELDEIAIWTRALTATEVQQLYQRGANRVRFQIRSCLSPTCADNPTWLGPDGSSATYFTELNNNTAPSTGLGAPLTGLPNLSFADYPFLILSNSRYFQYQMLMQTDNTSYRPSVRSVSTSY
jgi:hypothetical protein